jgi:uncharacterized protein (DUF1330 family)
VAIALTKLAVPAAAEERYGKRKIYMAAYVLASCDIVDTENCAGYVPGVVPLLAKHGAEILVADYHARCLDGEKRSAHVVSRFESEQVAFDRYNNPAYERVKQVPIDSSANGSAVLAKQLFPADRFV